MTKLDVLRRSELFLELNEEQLGAVAKMCSAEAFERGAVICRQDCEEDKIHVIEEGLVGIIVEVGPLSKRQVQSASKSDVVGWSAMVASHTCTATAKALEKTKTLSFDGQELCNLCLSRPDIGLKVCTGVTRVVARRLREAYTQLLGVTYQD